MDRDQLDKSRREVLRWRIIQTCNIGRPYPVAEDIIYQTVAGPDMPVTEFDVRKELDYLESRKLVEIEGRNGFLTSCTRPVENGMVVQTDTPALR